MPWSRSPSWPENLDVESSTAQSNLVSSSSGSTQHHWTVPIAIQLQDRPSLLTCTTVYDADHALVIWSAIRHVVTESIRRHGTHSRWYLLFSKPMVGTSRVDQVMHCCTHPSEAIPCCPVVLGPFKHSVVLTEAYRNAHVHPPSPTLLSHSQIWSKRGFEEVITIRHELDRYKVAWLLMLLLIVSPGLGLAVGWASHRADVGVGVSAAVFALASFLQGWFVWLEG